MPAYVFEEVFAAFNDFAKPVLDARAEPAAMILVVPWNHGAQYPPGAVVTRDGKLGLADMLAAAQQLHKMADRLYELAHNSLQADLQKKADATAERDLLRQAGVEPG